MTQIPPFKLSVRIYDPIPLKLKANNVYFSNAAQPYLVTVIETLPQADIVYILLIIQRMRDAGYY